MEIRETNNKVLKDMYKKMQKENEEIFAELDAENTEVKGSLISVWSYRHGWGTSSVLAMIVHRLSQKTNKSVLCVDANFSFAQLDKIFGINETKNTIDTAMNLAGVGEALKVVGNQTTKIKGTNINILPGTRINNYEKMTDYMRNNKEKYQNLVNELLKSFDIVVWDLNAGMHGIVSSYVIEKSDIVVEVLKPEKITLADYVNKRKAYLGDKENKLPVLNFYEDDIVFDVDVIKEILGEEEVFTLPYSSEVLNAINEATVRQFVSQKNNYTVMLDKIVYEIMNRLDIDEVKVKSGLFGLFK